MGGYGSLWTTYMDNQYSVITPSTKGENTSMTIEHPEAVYVNSLSIQANQMLPKDAWGTRERALYMDSRLYTLDQAKEIRDAIDGVIDYVEGNKPLEPTFHETLEAARIGSKLKNETLVNASTFIKLGTGQWVDIKNGTKYHSFAFNARYTLTAA